MREPGSHGQSGDLLFFRIGVGFSPMAGQIPKVDEIVQELLERKGTKEERMKLFRELVRRGDDLPEEMLDSALKKLMERLAE